MPLKKRKYSVVRDIFTTLNHASNKIAEKVHNVTTGGRMVMILGECCMPLKYDSKKLKSY